MTEATVFRVPVDDETMEALLEQAAAARVEPRMILAAIARDVLLTMKAHGATFGGRAPETTH